MKSVIIIEETHTNGISYEKKTHFDGNSLYIKDDNLIYDIMVDLDKRQYYFIDDKNKRYSVIGYEIFKEQFVSKNPLANLKESEYSIEYSKNLENYNDKKYKKTILRVTNYDLEIEILLEKSEISLEPYYTKTIDSGVSDPFKNLLNYQKDNNLYPVRTITKKNGIIISETILKKLTNTNDTIDTSFKDKYQKVPLY